METKTNSRRYRLHKIVRSYGIEVNPRKKTIKIPKDSIHSNEDEVIKLIALFNYRLIEE
jgi:hypothetical protein